MEVPGYSLTAPLINRVGRKWPTILGWSPHPQQGPFIPWAPSVIFCVSSAVAGAALLPLPETLGAPMPDTIQEMPAAGRCAKPGRRKGNSSLCIVNKGEEMEAK
ncbi:uncharacterized protein LOC119582273 [Penaeus monodon]|uniref:uncharacterized protein LOC119582273 n=1 Tax=Penaeus monodon TaxID=6687 RepID=UPI0018A70787|nr:uncharacterized protein LOC119582273 [Penaeus monodon]